MLHRYYAVQLYVYGSTVTDDLCADETNQILEGGYDSYSIRSDLNNVTTSLNSVAVLLPRYWYKTVFI